MIELHNLTKTFSGADGAVEALKNVSLTIPDGVIYGIIGMSGAGKSTLVRCIDLLERPTSGSVVIDGKDVAALPTRELRAVRKEISMIFQGFHLLMQRSCLKNICFPLELAGKSRREAKKRALELLELVGLPDKADAYPAQLSGGQQQRVAIARALASDPKVLLCDEATSALDPSTTASILRLLREINERLGITIIMITHQMQVVEQICSHVAILDSGTVAEQGLVSEVFAHPKSKAARRLVYPDGVEQILSGASGEHRLRVVFNGSDAAATPLIAKMAIEKNIVANILSASTRLIGAKVYGNMLLGIPGGDDQLALAASYLSGVPDVQAQEVTEDA